MRLQPQLLTALSETTKLIASEMLDANRAELSSPAYLHPMNVLTVGNN